MRSLTGRLVATTVALVAITCLLIAAAATVVLRTYLLDRLDTDVARSLERVQQVVHGDRPNPNQFDSPPPTPLGSREGSVSAIITTSGSATGTAVTSSGDRRALTAEALSALASVSPGDPQTVDVPGLGRFRAAAVLIGDQAVLVQGIPTDDVDDTITTLIWWEAGLGLAGVAAAAVAGRLLVRHQLASLRAVAETAERVTELDLTTGEVGRTERVPDELADASNEVGQVGAALNRLLGHVEASLEARHESEQQARQFLADASHELRTPLTTIKGYAELSRKVPDADELSRVLSKVEMESARMTRLVEDMLDLARLDAGRDITPAAVDLSRIVAEAVRDAAVVDPDRTWSIDVPTEPVVITGDEQRLHQLVTNLLRNASQHTVVGTTVTTVLSQGPAQTTLAVDDNDPTGIDPELLPTIFDRFTRGDPKSRTRDSGGAGLGASLVQAIAHSHGGQASVTSTPGNTRFVVTLPRS